MSTRPARQRLALAALALFVTLGATVPAFACPNCKFGVPTEETAPDADARPDARQTLAPTAGQGYNYSIYLLMAAPFALMGAFGGGLYVVMRKPSHQSRTTKSE